MHIIYLSYWNCIHLLIGMCYFHLVAMWMMVRWILIYKHPFQSLFSMFLVLLHFLKCRSSEMAQVRKPNVRTILTSKRKWPNICPRRQDSCVPGALLIVTQYMWRFPGHFCLCFLPWRILGLQVFPWKFCQKLIESTSHWYRSG